MCNIEELWWPEVKSQDIKTIQEICAYFGKMTPCGNIFKNAALKVFIATLIDVLCLNFMKFGRWQTGEIVRCSPDKKFAGSSTVSTAQIAPKSARDSPRQCTPKRSTFRPNRFTLVEL